MVLIIDDHVDNGRLLARLLKTRGHDAFAVSSGRMALSLLPNLEPDLVILDKCMPEMDEMEVLRRIRSDPQSHSTPVIFYSADGNPDEVERARSLGAQDYLVKGVTPWEAVFSTVARYA
jgi:CheY-like chemotaxis protein